MLGALAGSFLFPHTIAKLTAVMYAPLTWGQEHADNWNYYRWLLLDEYPIIFGCLSILLLSCLLKNTKNGLFLCCALLIPFFLHSVILPMKTYRYIMYLLPLMFMAAGVGVATIFQYVWTASKQLNIHGYVSHRNMAVFVSGVLALVMMGTLINMPWFLRTLKDYTTDFQSPHVTDVQHHHWNHAVHYISEHSAEGDVIVSGYPLLTRHYGATQPLYFMNTTYLPHNIQRNFRNEQGELIDYTFGAPVLSSLDDLQRIMKSHRSGWIMTYKWRNERYWNNPDHATSISGTFPDDVLQYMEDNLELQEIPNAPDMALWRWNAEIS